MKLTKRQAQVLSFIRWRRMFEYEVTLRDIGEHFGICYSAAWNHVAQLKEKGFVQWVPFKANTLTVCDRANGVPAKC